MRAVRECKRRDGDRRNRIQACGGQPSPLSVLRLDTGQWQAMRYPIDAGDVDSAAGRALLEERYRALQRQIPLLYGIAVAAFLGLSRSGTGAMLRPRAG